ncbi:MAG: hypothetical protein H0W89_03820 [Candidatus Levybacteria bacterium]|nr:hypothetical protein [Candidatus Levybacteria bacterium]
MKGGEKYMLKVKTTLIASAATGALFLSAITPALAAHTDISGNGAFSRNDVSVSSSNSTTVNQSNDADIRNDISTNASTGNNSSSFNTGGDSRIDTGDANSFVSIANMANANSANVGNAGSVRSADISISGNGAFSDTSVRVEMDDETRISQDNRARFDNNIDTNNQTGNNRGDFNTGRNGSTDIRSGDSDAIVFIRNEANTNMLGMSNGYANMDSNWYNSSDMNDWMNHWYSMHMK